MMQRVYLAEAGLCHTAQMQGMADLLLGVGILDRLSISLSLQWYNVAADQ